MTVVMLVIQDTSVMCGKIQSCLASQQVGHDLTVPPRFESQNKLVFCDTCGGGGGAGKRKSLDDFSACQCLCSH
jgi:hypothetical protein